MGKVSLTINGVKLQTGAGATVLEAAREAGIYIPTLCAHRDLPNPLGNCRLCVVQVEGGGFPNSCVTPVAQGMKVHTDSPQVKEVRRHVFKALLTPLPSPRLGRPEIKRLAQYIGIKEEELPPYVSRNLPVDMDEPLFINDRNLCIFCGRCVRACIDLRGVEALDFVSLDGTLVVGPYLASSLKGSGCKFDGACVEVCPTGALMDRGGDVPDHKTRVFPCVPACPAQIDIPRYVRLVAESRFAEAAAVVREKVPFPGVLGTVCSHPCEQACRRGELNANEPISIMALKRVAAERDSGAWRAKSKVAKPTGKKVAIVGSGPAGLTAGYYLAKLGHAVTIFEALPEPGGMMRVGIPEYRLPREVLTSDLDEIKRVGVEIRTKTRVASVSSLFKQGYDAVFLATGAHQSAKLDVPGEELPGVVDCLSFLRDVNLGKEVKLQGRVAVIGGGNAAIDSARSALRLGATEVTIVYRRSRKEMPAYPEEVEAALEEKAKLIFLAAPTAITKKDGTLKVEFIRMKLGSRDESGRRRPVPIEGSEFTMEFDTVISAIGQMPELPNRLGLKLGSGNTVKVTTATLATSKQGVFAGGDVVLGAASVVEAVAQGRKAAVSIDKYLGGRGVIDEKLVEVEEASPYLGPGNGFADIHRVPMPRLPARRRVGGFGQVELGLTEDLAIEEAKRCLQCQLRLLIRPAAAAPAK